MLYLIAACSSSYVTPMAVRSQLSMSKVSTNKVVMDGKGFGGGEATRDPEPTHIDPNDPKSKQQAIHKAESFADYLASRSGGATASKGRRVHPLG